MSKRAPLSALDNQPVTPAGTSSNTATKQVNTQTQSQSQPFPVFQDSNEASEKDHGGGDSDGANTQKTPRRRTRRRVQFETQTLQEEGIIHDLKAVPTSLKLILQQMVAMSKTQKKLIKKIESLGERIEECEKSIYLNTSATDDAVQELRFDFQALAEAGGYKGILSSGSSIENMQEIAIQKALAQFKAERKLRKMNKDQQDQDHFDAGNDNESFAGGSGGGDCDSDDDHLVADTNYSLAESTEMAQHELEDINHQEERQEEEVRNKQLNKEELIKSICDKCDSKTNPDRMDEIFAFLSRKHANPRPMYYNARSFVVRKVWISEAIEFATHYVPGVNGKVDAGQVILDFLKESFPGIEEDLEHYYPSLHPDIIKSFRNLRNAFTTSYGATVTKYYRENPDLCKQWSDVLKYVHEGGPKPGDTEVMSTVSSSGGDSDSGSDSDSD